MDQGAGSSASGTSDSRVDVLGNYVQKTLKLKPEKWTRMMATEEHKAQVKMFLDKPYPPMLIILLTHTAQLVSYTTFPLLQLKTKGKKNVFP